MSDVRVRVTAQNETRTGFQQALGDARKFGQEARKSIGGGLGGVGAEIRSSLVGALAGIGIGQFVRSTFEQFGRINDLSQQFGVSAEALQRFGQVASESGSNIEQVAVAFSTLTRNLQSAQSGTGAQAEALQKLGLSAADLANLSPEQAFLRLADALAGASNRNEAYAAALDLIGARQRNLIPLLQQGSAAILEQANQVQVASDEIIAKADEVGDRFARLGQQVTAGLGPVAVTLGSIFLDAFESIKTRVQQLGGFITSALLAAGQAATGNFGVARDILSGAVDEWQRLGEQFQKTRQEIWSEPPQTAMRGMLPPEGMEETPRTSSPQKSATQKGNVTGRQLSPGSIEGIREFEREQEAARRALGPEFGPGTAEAAAGGFRVDAAMFQQQQAEEAAKALAAISPDTFGGAFGASALQRIGGASEEFFRVRPDEQREQKRTNELLKQINEAIRNGEPLVLKGSK
jgi:uncharacterized phage infection (PIP) family protein YhgE